MAEYKSAYTGAQIDQGIKNALAVTPITLGGTGANNAPTALDNLGAASKWDLLWENASPKSDFAAQDVTIDGSKYNMFLFIFRTHSDDNYVETNYGNVMLSAIAYAPVEKNEYRARLSAAIYNTDFRAAMISRSLIIHYNGNVNSLHFGNPVYASASNTIYDRQSYAIPLQIFGTKV